MYIYKTFCLGVNIRYDVYTTKCIIIQLNFIYYLLIYMI